MAGSAEAVLVAGAELLCGSTLAAGAGVAVLCALLCTGAVGVPATGAAASGVAAGGGAIGCAVATVRC